MQTTNSVSEEWGLAEAKYFSIKRFVVLPKKEFRSMWAYRLITTGTYEEMEALKKLMKAAHANDKQ